MAIDIEKYSIYIEQNKNVKILEKDEFDKLMDNSK